ncbi:GNAT family N-acetyltransferase [Sphingomonas flavalba]|uniref:GNAT family N-acetyltransferase n=1 Tax=Sphingomonas flavalba TaxID=2559804 RepID=UPI0039E11D1B
MVSIVPLSAIPDAEVEALLDRAFGADRHGRTAYRLRAGTRCIPALSLAATDAAGRFLGSVQSWPVRLDDDPLVMVGPVAVEPAHQQHGIGRALMTALIAAADASALPGADALMMIGDPEYYGRFFGFTADATGGWSIDGPVERRRLLARLRPGRRVAADGAILPRTDAPAG